MDKRHNSEVAINMKPVRACYEVKQWLDDISDVDYIDTHGKNDTDNESNKEIRCNSNENLSDNCELDDISLYILVIYHTTSHLGVI